MNPTEIVKKVLRRHMWSPIRFRCGCGWTLEMPTKGDYHTHVASEIVDALGLAQIAPTHGQERPNPANVGTGEGTGLEGAQIGAQEIKPERPREGE